MLNRKDLLPGDIFLYKPEEDIPVSEAIALGEVLSGQPGKYVHLGVWLGEDREIAAYSNGIQISGKNPQICDVFRINVTDTKFSVDSGIKWATEKAGHTPYAYWELPYVWAVHLFRVNPPIEFSDSRMICSVFVARFLEKCGVKSFPGKFYCTITPDDFINARGISMVGSMAKDA